MSDYTTKTTWNRGCQHEYADGADFDVFTDLGILIQMIEEVPENIGEEYGWRSEDFEIIESVMTSISREEIPEKEDIELINSMIEQVTIEVSQSIAWMSEDYEAVERVQEFINELS